MDKTLQEQYNLIKEGKGNKQQFFKSARHIFPDLVTPVNTFEDTVRILKNRGIISEGIGGVVTKGKTPDWHSIFNKNMNSLNELERTQIGMYLMFDKKTGKLENYIEFPDHKENNNLKKQIEDKGQYVLHFITGNDYNKFKNSLNKYKGKTRQELDLLTEAKEAKAVEKEPTKDVVDMETKGYDYKDKKNYDNVFGEEFLKGFYTEMGDSKNEGKTVEELRAIVAKNLAKDINHYAKEGQFGLKGVGYTTEAPGLGTPKEAKGKHKSSGYGDLKESVLRSQIHILIKEILTEISKDEATKSSKGDTVEYKKKGKTVTSKIVSMNLGAGDPLPTYKLENGDEVNAGDVIKLSKAKK
jgi:hypothetical protein